jgi:hypothetical protein
MFYTYFKNRPIKLKLPVIFHANKLSIIFVTTRVSCVVSQIRDFMHLFEENTLLTILIKCELIYLL